MADKKISALTAAATPLAGTEVLPIVQSGSTVKVAVSDLTLGRNVSLLGLTATGTTQKLGAVTLADITVQVGPDTPVTTSSGRILFNTSSTQKNWFINHNWNLAGGLSFAQSTAAGGSTMGSDSHQWDSSGNYKVVNGNVVIGTAGKGIDFSANTHAAGMTSELLNWYEEGAWTPSVGGDATYTIQEGLYVRVGDLVYVQCQLVLNVLGTGSTTTISGLPFQAFNPSNSSRGTGSVWYCGSLATNVTSIVPGVTPAGQTITFGGFTAAGASMSVPLTVFQNGTRVDFAMTYRAN
jgi:hypothetical protein